MGHPFRSPRFAPTLTPRYAFPMDDTIPTELLAFDCVTKTQAAHDLLQVHYGRPKPEKSEKSEEELDLIIRIIRVIIAQNTSKANQARALERLRRRFPDPALIAEAPLADVVDAIYVAGLANSKAPRLQAMIEQLLEATDGTLELDFLREMPAEEARIFLMKLPGIGPLSASLVLLFGLNRPVLPVNTGLHRVALRVGMLPPNASAERAHDLLQAMLEDDEIYPFHVNMVRHARQFCASARPKCESCPLAVICNWVHGR
ncbi:MAG: endonuclease III [Chloroflexota bacterium]|nr:endonuclease III [Chloroflexota bacterium]